MAKSTKPAAKKAAPKKAAAKPAAKKAAPKKAAPRKAAGKPAAKKAAPKKAAAKPAAKKAAAKKPAAKKAAGGAKKAAKKPAAKKAKPARKAPQTSGSGPRPGSLGSRILGAIKTAGKRLSSSELADKLATPQKSAAKLKPYLNLQLVNMKKRGYVTALRNGRKYMYGAGK